jgi:hypothetical protein
LHELHANHTTLPADCLIVRSFDIPLIDQSLNRFVEDGCCRFCYNTYRICFPQLRVSGIFTNAPFILNLDCDMYVNDGQALLQAMCFFMDRNSCTTSSPAMAINDSTPLAFVQFPQAFEWLDEADSGGGPKVALEVLIKLHIFDSSPHYNRQALRSR